MPQTVSRLKTAPNKGKPAKPARQPPNPAFMAAHAKLLEIRNYVNTQMLEREAETDSALISILSGASCFYLGDAGAGKTQHIQLITSLLGLSLFDTLMSETTKPESIFGPVDVPALAKGIQRVKTKGYAPDAEVLFLDEIFKASDVVLNPLLWLLNEYKFRNGDEGVIDCPTITVFAASNEVPLDKGSRPIYDRFLIRHSVDYIKTRDNLTKLFMNVTGQNTAVRPTPMTREQVHLLRASVTKVKVPPDVWDIMLRIRDNVKQAVGVIISDRRMVKALRVVQASALLHRRSRVDLADLEILAHMFWDQPEQIRRVRSIVMAHSSSIAGDLISYSEMAESVYNTAVSTGDLDTGLAKLEEITDTTSTFTTQSGIAIHRTVTNYLQQLQAIAASRKEFTALVLRDENGNLFYKLSDACAQVWTKQEIRSVGFRFYRALAYWWYDASSKNAEKRLSNAVLRTLGSKLVLQRMPGVE